MLRHSHIELTGLARRASWLSLLILLSAACGEPPTSEPAIGTARFALVGSTAEGATYRLRSVRFSFAGAGDPVVFQPDDDAEVALTDLPVGDYEMTVGGRWQMERLNARGEYEPVRAALESDNPVPVTVTERATTDITLQFLAGDEFIELGHGRVSIDIDVDDGPGPRADDGPGDVDACARGCIENVVCPDGQVDLDRDPANGCEYACEFVGGDVPDRGFGDRNCDGVEGDAEASVFVALAPLGSPDGDGSRAAPVDTITRGITIADVQGHGHVLVAEGEYSERVEMVEGVDVHGGYQPDGLLWPRRAHQEAVIPTTIRFHTYAVRARNFVAVTALDNLVIRADSPFDGFATVAAVRVESASVVLRDCRVEAGPGSAGNNGQPGAPGLGGDHGATGAAGIENSSSAAPGGAGGGSACGGVGGGGGGGGYYPAAGGTGTTGAEGDDEGCAPGAIGVGAGGVGGESNDNAGPLCGSAEIGEAGGGGGSGLMGCAGPGGNGGEADDALGWRGAAGNAGSRGGDGDGGGGGGGGGDNACGLEIHDRGAGGCGGGGGGCGGDGGQAGQGGGGSFGVLSFDGIVIAVGSHIIASDGGNGGHGGLGGLGGNGGFGGLGGAESDDAAAGGLGGNGGNGACGGGGQGGFSFAVYQVGADAGFEAIESVLEFDEGGVGGDAPCLPGQPGQHGLAGQIGATPAL
jgi:hypothetical protein